jgi:hypothetical protein
MEGENTVTAAQTRPGVPRARRLACLSLLPLIGLLPACTILGYTTEPQYLR